MLDFDDNFFQNKSKFIIGTLCFILLAIIIIIIFVYRSQQVESSNNPTLSPIPTRLPLPTIIENPIIPTSPPTPIPKPGDIIIDGIAVNDFKKTAVRTDPNGDIILAETSEYQIVFNETGQKFTLIIFGMNFETSEQNATNKFLQLLGIDEMNVCRLYIEEVIPTSVNNKHAGKVYPLSKCVHDHNDP